MALRHSILLSILLLGLLSSDLEVVSAQTDPPADAPASEAPPPADLTPPTEAPSPPKKAPSPPPKKAPSPPPKKAPSPPPKSPKAPAPITSQGVNVINAASTVSSHAWPGLIVTTGLLAVLAR
ncbi:hypothetical protein R1flu_004999 [Riccia fluitans]|uniref:Arabinogalactan-like protein n=1 Tax=Riccia fluitans TaxID=41844 RepID=A0ABD1YSP5_9MARC